MDIWPTKLYQGEICSRGARQHGHVGRWSRALAWVCVLALVSAAVPKTVAQEKVPSRAEAPSWDRLPPGIFFENAFQEGLRGERPATLVGGRSGPKTAAENPAQPSTTANSADWKRFVSAASLEDEIKSIHGAMTPALINEGYFKGQGYRELRPHLATAAVVFGVIDQYPGRVRWQNHAGAARDQLALAAANAKVGSSATFREAKSRQQDLTDLIRGAALPATNANPDWQWADIADRTLLMQRLELGLEHRLSPALGSDNQLRQQHRLVIREAELAAMVMEVLMQPDMPDAADDEYRAAGQDLQEAARTLVDATQQEDIASAQRAQAALQQSCDRCHTSYR